MDCPIRGFSPVNTNSIIKKCQATSLSAALLLTLVSPTLGFLDLLSLHLQYLTAQAPLLASLDRVLPLLRNTGLYPAPSVDLLVTSAFPVSPDPCSCPDSLSPMGKKSPQYSHFSRAGHPSWMEHTTIFTHSMCLWLQLLRPHLP